MSLEKMSRTLFHTPSNFQSGVNTVKGKKNICLHGKRICFRCVCVQLLQILWNMTRLAGSIKETSDSTQVLQKAHKDRISDLLV